MVTTIEVIYWMAVIWLSQMAIAAIINAFNATRISKSIWDFFLLTFLPYVIFNRRKIECEAKTKLREMGY